MLGAAGVREDGAGRRSRCQTDEEADHGQSPRFYARYSSDLQNPRSIEDQEGAVPPLVRARRPWCRSNLFLIAALSGASIHGRTGLKNLIAGAVERRFDVVIVESLRSRCTFAIGAAPDLGNVGASAAVNLWPSTTGRASEISIGVRGLVGALYLTDLASKTRRGLAGKLAQGSAPALAPTAIGRSSVGPASTRSTATRRQWCCAFSATTPRATPAATLRPPSTARASSPFAAVPGTPHIHGSAKRASGNEICNEVLSRRHRLEPRRQDPQPADRAQGARVNPRSEWQRIEAPHLRIVPEELGRRPRRGSPRRRNANCGWKGVPPRRILSGLLRCGACGSSMVSAGSQRAGRWRGAPARSSRGIARIAASAGLT